MSYPRTRAEASILTWDDWEGLLDHSLEKSWSYLIRNKAGTYEVLDDRHVEHSSADLATEINWALANLSAGRTWKEKVFVKVDAETGVDQIVIPSYSILELQGKLTAKTNLNKSLVVNSDQMAGNTDITLTGGHYDANKENQTADMSCIFFDTVTRPECYNLIVRGGTRPDAVARGEGIEFYESTYGKIMQNYCYEAYYDNIKVRGGSTYCTVANNTCVNSETKGGIQVSSAAGGTRYINVVANVIYQNVHALDNCIRLHGSDHVNVVANTMYAHHSTAIQIIDSFAILNVIKGNIITTDHGTGIDLGQTSDPTYNEIVDNTITILTGGAGSHGIVIDYGDYNTVKGNDIYGANNLDIGIELSNTATNNNIGFNELHNLATKISNLGITTCMLDPLLCAGSSATTIPNDAVTKYMAPWGRATPMAAETDIYQIVPQDSYMAGLYVRLNIAPGGATSRVFTVQRNGGPTALTCTIAGAGTTAEDVQNWVYFARGDTMSLQCAAAGGNPAASFCQYGWHMLPVSP